MVQAVDDIEERDLAQAFHLLGEMNTSVLQVAQLVDNMLIRVKNGEISTDTGLSFLEMKYHMLLSYLINITYVVLRKCSGKSIKGDPSIDRLIEIRTVLERMRPIDHKLKYQINKLVKTAITGTTDNNDPNKFRANPDALLIKLHSINTESEEDVEEQKALQTKQSQKSSVYIPPKWAAMHYGEGDNSIDQIQKAGERAWKHCVSGTVLQELKEEYLDAPAEDVQGLSKEQAAFGRENKRKIEYEEHYMTRLPVAKHDKHRRRHITTLGTLGDEIVSFGKNTSIQMKKKRSQEREKYRRRKIRKI